MESHDETHVAVHSDEFSAAGASSQPSGGRFLSPHTPLLAIPEVNAAPVATNRERIVDDATGTWTTVVTPVPAADAVAADSSNDDAAAPSLPQFPLGRTATAPESAGLGRTIVAGGLGLAGLGGGVSGASIIGRQLGLHASAAMGARQPSAPNTPASSLRGGGPGAPTLAAAHSLSLPNSATRLRRPSVSLLTSAHELPDAEAAFIRAQSASTGARSGGLMSPANAAAAAAGSRSFGATTPNAASGSASMAASASASAHSAAAASSYAPYAQAHALPSVLSSAAPAPAFARPDAMISYSRKDLPFVRLLASAFEHSGRSVWVDFQSIPKAVDFMEAIRTGIRESNSFIYIISPDSVASKYCDLELSLAVEMGKRIIPIVVREVAPEKVRPEISAVNWIMCCAKQPPASVRGNGPSPPIAPPVPPSVYLHDLFPHILASVLIDPAFVLMHTKLLVRAMEWSESGEDSSFLATGRELEEANKFMERSRAYQKAHAAEAQQRQQGLVRGSRTGSISAGSAVLLNAPAVTRVQKLFLFASNERVQATQKKEQMLLKFLEDVSNDDHMHTTGNSPGAAPTSLMSFPSFSDPASSTLHSDLAGLDDLDVATMPDRSSSSRETSPPRPGGSRERAPSSATTTTTTTTTSVERFEHGSLSNRSSISGADGTPGSNMRNRFESSASRSGTPVSATPMRRRSSVSANGSSSASAGGSAALHRFSLVTSRASLFHRGGGLRKLLAAQAELMAGFLSVVEGREKERAKEEALRADQERAEQEARKRALEAAATAAVAGASESAATAATAEATSPEWSPGSAAASAAAAAVAAAAAASSATAASISPSLPPPKPASFLSRSRHQFARLRFELYTIHESLGFHLAFRALLALEAGLVLCGLMLALGPFSPAILPTLFARTFHALWLGSLCAFALEMAIFVLPIHAGWRRLKHQPVYVVSLGLLVLVGAMEVWGRWSGCSGGALSLGAAAVRAAGSSSIATAACSGKLLIWSLLLRSWHVLLRGLHCLLLHPLYFSLSSLHASVIANRSLVSKLKHMLRLLNGEMQQKENSTKLKWERLKSFHPARRYSIAQGSNGGIPGLPLPPPNLALHTAAATGVAAAGSAASSGSCSPTSRAPNAATKARRSLPPTLPGSYATIPRTAAASRGSTILPGAYGGAGAGASSLAASQAPRRSIMMSPSKRRGAAGAAGLQDKYATMPALNSAAIASAAVAAAENSLANSPVEEPLSASLPPPLPPSPLSAGGTPDAAREPSISVRISPIHEPDIDITPDYGSASASDSANTVDAQHAPPPPHIDTGRESDAELPLPSPPPDMPPEDEAEASSQSAQESDDPSSESDEDDGDEDEEEDEGDDDNDGAQMDDVGNPDATAELPRAVSEALLQQHQHRLQRPPEMTVAASRSALPPPHPPHVAAATLVSPAPPGSTEPLLASSTPLSSTSPIVHSSFSLSTSPAAAAAAASPAAAPSSSSLDVLHLTSPPSAFSPRSLPTPPSDPLAAASAAAAAGAAAAGSSPPRTASTVALTPNAETALSPESVDPPPPPRAQAKGGRVGSTGVRRKSRRAD